MDVASQCSHFGCKFSNLAGGFRGTVGQTKDFVGGPACCRERIRWRSDAGGGAAVNDGGGDCAVEDAAFEFGVVVEVYALDAGVGHAGNEVGGQTIGGRDGSVVGSAIGFCVLPVLDPLGPSGCDSVVVLGVGGEAERDAAFSSLDGDFVVGGFLLFDLARRRG